MLIQKTISVKYHIAQKGKCFYVANKMSSFKEQLVI